MVASVSPRPCRPSDPSEFGSKPRLVARDGFVKAPRAAYRWLDELLSDPTQSIESLAVRESKSERSIRMTLSLAFLSPVLKEAAMEGRLPRGFSIRRLTELPVLWSEQWTPWDFGNRLRRRRQSADSKPRLPVHDILLHHHFRQRKTLAIDARSRSRKRNFAA